MTKDHWDRVEQQIKDRKDSGESGHAAISSHPFFPQPGRPWMCDECNLGEAAHADTVLHR